MTHSFLQFGGQASREGSSRGAVWVETASTGLGRGARRQERDGRVGMELPGVLFQAWWVGIGMRLTDTRSP